MANFFVNIEPLAGSFTRVQDGENPSPLFSRYPIIFEIQADTAAEAVAIFARSRLPPRDIQVRVRVRPEAAGRLNPATFFLVSRVVQIQDTITPE